MSVAAVNNTQSAFASENTVEAPAPEAAEDAPKAGEEAPAPDAGEEAPAPVAGEEAPEKDPAAKQASLFQVAYAEVAVTEGDVAEIAAPTFTDAESGAAVDAPAGTTFALKSEIAGVNVDEATGAITVGEPATAAAPSTGVYEVAVTYPDGSKKTAVATVKVVPTEQAKLYQPEYAPATVELGKVGTIEAPKFTDEESGEERDMPEGTTFALKDAPIDGVTINEETGEITVESTYAAVKNVYEVLVTYPDGSSEVVVATIDVIDTPAEEEPGEEQPGEEQSGEEQPGEEQPGEKQPGEGDLARTGAEVGGLMALMASLIAGAASLFTIRRRKSEQ